MDFRKSNREKVFRYSIRKYHFGAASVAVAALMFLPTCAVAASETVTQLQPMTWSLDLMVTLMGLCRSRMRRVEGGCT